MLGVSLRFPISRNDFQRVESSSLGFHFHAPFDSAILLFHAIAFFIFLESVITRAASSASAKREKERERGERERERERVSATHLVPSLPPRAYPLTVPKRMIKNNHLNRAVRMKGQI